MGSTHLVCCPSFETVAEFTSRYSRGDFLRVWPEMNAAKQRVMNGPDNLTLRSIA